MTVARAMSFFRTAVLFSAICRIARGDDDDAAAGDVDTTGFFHVPSDLAKERLAFNEYFNDLIAKANNPNSGEIGPFGRGADGARSTFYTEETSTPEPFDSWSILWYFASFSGLIVFFLVVSCSEWCCRKHIRRNNQSQQSPATTSPAASGVPEAPPPAYDLFAPPSYESLTSGRTKEKSEYDVYVVPVHALGTVLGAGAASDPPEDAPPSYSAVNMNFVPEENANANA